MGLRRCHAPHHGARSVRCVLFHGRADLVGPVAGQAADGGQRTVSRVAAYDLGSPDGTTLTFLHGYPSSSLDIDAALATSSATAGASSRSTFPGSARPDKPTDHRYSIHAAADAVERVWAAAGLDSTVLVAHDYGVSIGQELLARRARRHARHRHHGGGVDERRPLSGSPPPDGRSTDADRRRGGAELAAALTEEMFVSGIRVTWGTRREMDDDRDRRDLGLDGRARWRGADARPAALRRRSSGTRSAVARRARASRTCP